MRRRKLLSLAGLACGLMPGEALANVFRSAPSGLSGPVPETGGGLWGGLVAAIYGLQASFYQAMNDSLAAMKADGTAGLYLAGFALLYGFFHAAGPGHGKVVVSSYVLADRMTLKKGIALSFLSAAIQGLVAIALISVVAIALQLTRTELMAQAGLMEQASYALVSLLGLWLMLRALGPLPAGWRPSRLQPALAASSAPAARANGPEEHRHAAPLQAHDHTRHDHVHHPHAACGCGHAHMPHAGLARQVSSPAEFLAAAFSIGLRPCSGALVVLVFALAQGLYAAGMAAVAVMSLGTALMVSLLAGLTVLARDAMLRLYGKASGRGSRRLSMLMQLAGGLLLVLFGGAMLLGPMQMS